MAEKLDLIESIEILQSKIKRLENLLRFHKLDLVPSKYKKAFPHDDESPYFEAPGFKEFTPKVKTLGVFCDKWDEVELPKDPKELEMAKERMRNLAIKAEKEKP